MRGSLVAELAELKGLQSRQSEYVKAFITRTHEEWIPKFKERAIKVPRRLVFIGTTNEREFLGDEEERRWLPVDVGMCKVDQITRDRDQLWAEAREAFKADGIAFADAERLARDRHHEYRVADPWTDDIYRWLNTEEGFGLAPKDRDFLTARDVMREALRMDAHKIDKRSEQRVGIALRELGWTRELRRVGPERKPSKVWVLSPSKGGT
jgi:predicted P-loop ATPase